ncbi:hypothetical protein B4O97_15610 [Marispirochaeta aestuarii]|uniref:HTH lacI-type domain-containing protein n=1 Tax=Marispirochaeta aestuarii TaxID=1963862 RepID=A0A1Y1RVP5_9SPIO|nr:LacI family DNA-binding transcriptional regulator [Marispirochaeta aestuarii]ORC32722.1 hypothetical protein B4O97_15610 [Marispirochaeta aestuarii]
MSTGKKNLKRVSSIDVAKMAGVSQATVSRVFTPAEKVSDVLRKKVLAAAKELNYQPNNLARSLNMRKTNIIGIVNPAFGGYFYLGALDFFTLGLQSRGYTVMLLNIPRTAALEDVIPIAFQYQVDGLITTAVSLSPKLIRSCMDLNVPVVQFNRYSKGLDVSAICLDNKRAGENAAEYLLNRGHSKIAYLSGDVNSSTNMDREKGLKQYLANSGKTLFDRYVGDYTYESGIKAGKKMMKQNILPDAVFCASDEMAFGLIDCLEDEFNLQIPADMSIIGFNNSVMAASPHYKLTTINQPVKEMVEVTIQVLLEKIDSDKDEVVLRMISGEIIERESVIDRT